MILDPIGGFDRIRDFFISYIETSFRVANGKVRDERRRLLETTNVFATSSFVEPVLRYAAHELRIEQMVGVPDRPLGLLPKGSQVAFAELALSGRCRPCTRRTCRRSGSTISSASVALVAAVRLSPSSSPSAADEATMLTTSSILRRSPAIPRRHRSWRPATIRSRRDCSTRSGCERHSRRCATTWWMKVAVTANLDAGEMEDALADLMTAARERASESEMPQARFGPATR